MLLHIAVRLLWWDNCPTGGLQVAACGAMLQCKNMLFTQGAHRVMSKSPPTIQWQPPVLSLAGYSPGTLSSLALPALMATALIK
eukprot:4267682-Pyramimonas_sp.AAC.1